MKHYPLWQQFVDNKSQWIGGELEDSGDSIDRVIFGAQPTITTIKDITLRPNGDEAFFCIHGEKFDCGFDTTVGSIPGKPGTEGWLHFSGYNEHRFRIRKPQTAEVTK